MFEAYAISLTLKLQDLVSPELKLLAATFDKLDGLAITLGKSLAKISLEADGFKKLASAANSTNKAFEKAGISAATFHQQLRNISATQFALGMRGAAAAGGIPKLPGGGGGGGGGNHTKGGLHGGNIHLGAGGVGLGTVGMAAGDWFWPLAAAGAGAYGGHALYESAKDLDTERARFRLFGMSDAQNSEAFKFADNMHIYGSSRTDNMRNVRESQGVFRESGLGDSEALAGAKLAAPILSKLNALDSALDDESAARSHSSNLAMLRFVESAGGLKSQQEFNRLSNLGYRLKVGSGDTVDWQKLQQFQATGGSATIGLSDEGYARLEPSISQLGSRAGTGLATGFGRLSGIVKNLQVPVIDELIKQGIWDKSKVELNSKGGISKFLDPDGPMSADNRKLLSENPELFYERVIRPMYKRMDLDAAGVIRQNAMIYGKTGGLLANEWEKSLGTIEKAVEAFKKTLSIGDATKNLPTSLTGQQEEFDKAWSDFKTEFGTSMLPFFSGILKVGAALLRSPNTVSFIKGMLNPFGTLWDVASGNKSFVPPAQGQPPINVTLTGDAERMGIALTPTVSRIMTRDMTRTQSSGSFFDDVQHLAPSGGF